jgi:hypothetical protein
MPKSWEAAHAHTHGQGHCRQGPHCHGALHATTYVCTRTAPPRWPLAKPWAPAPPTLSTPQRLQHSTRYLTPSQLFPTKWQRQARARCHWPAARPLDPAMVPLVLFPALRLSLATLSITPHGTQQHQRDSSTHTLRQPDKPPAACMQLLQAHMAAAMPHAASSPTLAHMLHPGL